MEFLKDLGFCYMPCVIEGYIFWGYLSKVSSMFLKVESYFIFEEGSIGFDIPGYDFPVAYSEVFLAVS